MYCMYVYTCSSEVCKAYNPDVNELHEVIYEEFDQGTYDGLYS